MYAITLIGSKQYKVSEGDILAVEHLPIAKEKDEISLDKVLLYSKGHKTQIGTPFLENVKVSAEILDEFKGAKVVSFKYRRRKGKHWKRGFRQHMMRLKIKEIAAK